MLFRSLIELPDEKRARFIEAFGLSPYDADVLIAEKERADYYELMLKEGAEPKAAANWLINEVLGRMNRLSLPQWRPEWPSPNTLPWSVAAMGPTSPSSNAAIIGMVTEATISGPTAKELLDISWSLGPVANPRQIVEERGLKQVTDLGAIETIVDDIIAANPDKVEQVKAKPTMLGWFVGQVMKAMGGKASPQAVNELLKAKLGIE